MALGEEMNAASNACNGVGSAKPLPLALAALGAAVAASATAGAIVQFGSLGAFRNATVASNLIAGAIGLVLLLPTLHVGIASLWERNRNSRSRRNIFLGWGIAITVLQLLIILSGIATPKNIPRQTAWRYVAYVSDPMDDVVERYASLTSRPAQSNPHNPVELRIAQPNAVSFHFESSSIFCSSPCTIRARFDRRRAAAFSVTQDEDEYRMEDRLVVDDPSLFLSELKRSKSMMVEFPHRVRGESVVVFDVAGFSSRDLANEPAKPWQATQ